MRRPLLFVALVLYAFSFQGTRGIWEPDEGLYTAVALEMGRLGDYVFYELRRSGRSPVRQSGILSERELRTR